jgi:spore coat protein CotH
VHAAIDFNGTKLQDVAIRYKGNSTFMQSRDSLKRSLKLDLNKYVKGQKIAGVSKLNLHSNMTDAAWMNEPLSYGLFRDASIPASRSSYARVYLTVAGKYDRQYVGLYSVVEEVDNAFAQERFGTRDGAILKPSTQSLFTYLGEDWSKYKQMYDPKTELTEKQKRRVIDFAKLVTSGSDAEFGAQAGSYLDIDEFARYLAVNVWLVNMDSILAMGQNFYLYLNPTSGKFQILPWDLDLSFGGMGGGTELSIEHPWRGQNRFLERLFQVEAFKQRYLAHMGEFNRSIFQAERIVRQVDETAAVIRSAVSEESEAKLTRFDKSVAGEAAVGGGGPGGRGPGRGAPIRGFAAPRGKSVAAQLAGESKGQQDSGFGPGGRGGPGGPGGPMNEVAASVVRLMDEDKDGFVSHDEFQRGFAKWFESLGIK